MVVILYSGIYGHIQSLIAIEVHDPGRYCNHSLQAISFVLTGPYPRWQELEWYTLCCISAPSMVHIKKYDADIWNIYLKCVCGAAAPQNRRFLLRVGRFLLRNGRLLLKSAGFIHKFPKCSAALLMDLLELRLCLPELRLVFWSCVCNGKANQ